MNIIIILILLIVTISYVVLNEYLEIFWLNKINKKLSQITANNSTFKLTSINIIFNKRRLIDQIFNQISSALANNTKISSYSKLNAVMNPSRVYKELNNQVDKLLELNNRSRNYIRRRVSIHQSSVSTLKTIAAKLSVR